MTTPGVALVWGVERAGPPGGTPGDPDPTDRLARAGGCASPADPNQRPSARAVQLVSRVGTINVFTTCYLNFAEAG